MFLMSTVDSGDDLLSWVDYLALPAEGWEGSEIPSVDAFASTEPVQLPLGFLFEEAHANPILRASKELLKRKLAQLRKKVGGSAKVHLPQALKIIRQELGNPSATELRKLAFKPEFVAAMAAVFAKSGARNIRNFLKGNTDARYSPVTILGTIAYLEWESACGAAIEEESELLANDPAAALEPFESERLECNDKGFEKSSIRAPLKRIYAKAFADVVSGRHNEETPDSPPNSENYINLNGGAHGAFFHLNQLAFFQLAHRFGNGPKVKGIERGRWLWFYKDDDDLDDFNDSTNSASFKQYRRNLRFVDIVLEESDGRETWIELKSLRAASSQNRDQLHPLSWPLEKWNMVVGSKPGKKSGYNRQYLLDQTAAKVGHARMTKSEAAKLTPPQTNQNAVISVTNNYQWRFQKFKVKKPETGEFIYSPRLGSATQKGSIRYGISQEPGGISGSAEKLAYQTNTQATDNGNDHVVYADVKDFLNQLKNAGFEMAEEALLAELEVED